MPPTNQDQLIGMVEDALALTGDIDEAHRFMALRGHELSREVIAELARASQATRKQQSILQKVRALVDKRARREGHDHD